MSPAIGLYAQRVVYPNGTRSDPFIVPMNKRDLRQFSLRVLENQRQDVDQWQDYDGRFMSTVRVLSQRCRSWSNAHVGDVLVGPTKHMSLGAFPGRSDDRQLSCYELAILFGVNEESGWKVLGDLVKDPPKALARTVLSWLPHIEEWEEPPR